MEFKILQRFEYRSSNLFGACTKLYNLSIIVIGMQKITDLSGVILIIIYTFRFSPSILSLPL